MTSFSVTFRMHQCIALVMLLSAFTAFSGCSERGAQEAGREVREAQVEPASTEERMATRATAGELLGLKDLTDFERGKAMTDILKEVEWRGNLQMATEYKGKGLASIGYAVATEPIGEGAIGDAFWAIFVDDKFEKFVSWPSWSNNPTFKLGDFSLLIEASESEPLKISELKDSLNVDSESPRQVDPGLTAAWLRLRKGVEAAQQRDLKRNAVLRAQFNAFRLRIGMTVAEVESVLKANPIESGRVEAGSFRIYGSTESLNVVEGLHYSNILVLVSDGRVSGIYSGSMVRGGKHGLEQMRQWFVDLPRSERDE
jgi:hypothetical protein